MHAWLWNGTAFEPAASVPLSDRGFRYGMSLFESLRVWDGRVSLWEPHRLRLLGACAEREIAVDERGVAQAVNVFSDAGVNGFARIYVTAGDGAPGAPIQAPRLFLLLEPRELEREDCWEAGLHDETYHPPFGGLKTGNYWFNCDALAQARVRGFDEALLFNDHAELVSACCANVFLVRDGKILTPSRASGCRLGVVREWVIKRRKVEERRLRREDVVNADEIFLTNSWLGVMPIATLEGRPLGPRSIGPRLGTDFASY
jgi:branched-subunit amino acid aminotransferase/4-amino-4-deoxychorismate lyase